MTKFFCKITENRSRLHHGDQVDLPHLHSSEPDETSLDVLNFSFLFSCSDLPKMTNRYFLIGFQALYAAGSDRGGAKTPKANKLMYLCRICTVDNHQHRKYCSFYDFKCLWRPLVFFLTPMNVKRWSNKNINTFLDEGIQPTRSIQAKTLYHNASVR